MVAILAAVADVVVLVEMAIPVGPTSLASNFLIALQQHQENVRSEILSLEKRLMQ